jgi:ribosome biogenesis GTPase A
LYRYASQLAQLLDVGKEVFVVGAQNSGKSSLINRLSKLYGGPGDGGPLASHLPGTTLGRAVYKLTSVHP